MKGVFVENLQDQKNLILLCVNYLEDYINNINDLSFKTLRRQIGIVQQDVFLFNGTMKENILYGKLDATEEEVIERVGEADIIIANKSFLPYL